MVTYYGVLVSAGAFVLFLFLCYSIDTKKNPMDEESVEPTPVVEGEEME